MGLPLATQEVDPPSLGPGSGKREAHYVLYPCTDNRVNGRGTKGGTTEAQGYGREDGAYGDRLIVALFGKTVGEKLTEGDKKKRANPKSKLTDRVEKLVRALLPLQADDMTSAAGMRYQLLTACAGALVEAERQSCDRSVMLVHEFITDKTDDGMHQKNSADLDNFLWRISDGKISAGETNHLLGPLSVPGAPLFSADIKLYLGKVQRDIRTEHIGTGT